MRHVFVCPTNDAFKIALVDMTVDRKIRGGIEFETYTPKEPPLYPFVPAYFQEYNQQRTPLREFLQDRTFGSQSCAVFFFLLKSTSSVSRSSRSRRPVCSLALTRTISPDVKSFP